MTGSRSMISLGSHRFTLQRASVTALTAAAFLALGLSGCSSLAADGPVGTGDLGLIEDTMRQVEKSYVVPVKPDQLVNGALKGMLTKLDPHSDYMTEDEYRELISTTSGQFGGVGIEISVEEGVPQVISAIDGTPAAAAGVEPGDRIVKADGQPIIGMDIGEVVRKLRGNPGTPVVLTIARANRPAFDLAITRAIIRVDSVKSALKPGGIGYVRISTFDENTPAELRAALNRLRQEAGGRLAGLVLDLRNDAGGLLDAAVEVTGDFLDSGTVVTTRGREAAENRVYDALPNGDLVRGTPVVVLINGASASASEIVAGALQDSHRATILGTHSFGKGSVQSIIPIEGHGALRLTTALYYTPSGRSIQGHGITPDRVVAVPKDQQVANAVITYESDLFGALKATGALAPQAPGLNGAPATPAPATSAPAPGQPIASEVDHPINPKVIGTAKDAQLSAALDLLTTRRAAAR
jgi:carboxyl-terminal processing protease